MRRLALLLVGLCSLVCAATVLAQMAVYTPPGCQTVTFHSAPRLGAERVCMNVGLKTHGVPSGDYLFLTPGSAGAGIFRPNGELVWWKRRQGHIDEDVHVVTLWGRHYLAVWSGRLTPSGSLGKVWLYNEHYQPVGLITAGGSLGPNDADLHEFQITPQNDALIGIWQTVTRVIDGRSQPVIQYVVQKLSLVRTADGIRTGKVLFQWSSLSHIPVTESHEPDPTRGAWDYFHGNSIAQDSDGNLIVSGRNTWGVYKISVRTGHVMWQVGGRGDHTLAQPWCYQHDVTPLGHDRYSLFDDGGSDPGCEPGDTGHSSRAIIFQALPGSGRPQIKLITAITHSPPTRSAVFGSVQLLPGGNVLVDWGTTPLVTEYDARDRRVALNLSLSLTSYRAFLLPWVGLPEQPPAIAASTHNGVTRVWTSWNGATEVAAWRVLGGRSASRLKPVTRPVLKSGFETAITLRREYPLVAVQALSRSDKVLSRSEAIHPKTSS
jgi:hypothetical protein